MSHGRSSFVSFLVLPGGSSFIRIHIPIVSSSCSIFIFQSCHRLVYSYSNRIIVLYTHIPMVSSSWPSLQVRYVGRSLEVFDKGVLRQPCGQGSCVPGSFQKLPGSQGRIGESSSAGLGGWFVQGLRDIPTLQISTLRQSWHRQPEGLHVAPDIW